MTDRPRDDGPRPWVAVRRIGLLRLARGTLRVQATARAARMLGSITAAGASTVSAAIARASRRTASNAVTGLGRKMKEAGSVALGTFTRDPSAPRK